MKTSVFLSWSGARSKEMAAALHGWLPTMLQEVDPFFSDQDIGAGEEWDKSIHARLEGAKFAVICITEENVSAPWVNYEAGYLAAKVMGGTVPWLLRLDPVGLKFSPLSRLMAKSADIDGTKHVVYAINQKLGSPLSQSVLDSTFKKQWPDLDDLLSKIPASPTVTPVRTEQDLLEESVRNTRKILEVIGPAVAGAHLYLHNTAG